jgi:hypothetical protein
MQAHEIIQDLETYPKKFVAPLQLARYLGVTARVIYYHIDKGALPAVVQRGIIRIPIEEARRYCRPNNSVSA